MNGRTGTGGRNRSGRALPEAIAGAAFPASWSDRYALRIGTGRRPPTGAERAASGPPAGRLPFVLG